jgi:FAD-dependent urate hydroxylase
VTRTALVIGAGVAGPVLAMALQRAGLHAEVFEGHPTGADDVGNWLTLQANGIDALRAVDAHRVVAERGFPQPVLRMFSGTGRELGAMSNGAPLPDGTPTQMLLRADLYAALRDEALARGASLTYGRRFVDATAEGGRVTATFADGTTACGDLLIGCDGIRSRVRQIIDPAAPAARYIPVLNVGGRLPARPAGVPDVVPGEFRMVFGHRCFWAWVAHPGGGVVWFANPPRAEEPAAGELDAIPDARWRETLVDLTAGDRDGAVFAAIVRTAPDPIRAWATYDLPKVPTWHRDNMIVIGDAAHATSPAAGQGAAMALEDAVILARHLRDLPDVGTAFAAFTAHRRRRVERIVAWGARSSSSKAAGPVGRVVRDALLPLGLRFAARANTAWIHAHHIDWDAPALPVG